MSTLLKWFVVVAALGVSALAAAAGDPKIGAVKATSCYACHGSDGVSINDLWPNLAGQKPGYLVKQIQAFRDGTRTDPIMPIYVKELSDEDIAHIAAYFASLSGVEKPLATLH